MRYFLRAAGRTFHVGSFGLSLKLFKLSELLCRLGFGEEIETPPSGGVTPGFSGLFEVEGNDGDSELGE
jgi:hypothetical protein